MTKAIPVENTMQQQTVGMIERGSLEFESWVSQRQSNHAPVLKNLSPTVLSPGCEAQLCTGSRFLVIVVVVCWS